MTNFKNNNNVESNVYSRKWTLDISETTNSQQQQQHQIKDKNNLPLPLTSGSESPISTSSSSSSSSQPQVASQQPQQLTAKQQMDLKVKKGWELAKSPAKNIFMTGFFLWMIGNGINIFTMPVIIYAVINPVKAIFQTNSMFSRFNDCKSDIIQMKLTFVVIQLALLSVTLYKCSSMGLLPITPSDWISSLPIKKAVEYSSGSSL
ncbi:hypothetical protein RB653_002759 [Dictyostelium firmibasis]|uniref:ER membrane protein complex subunit 4 n=1 Tax=Dictyostelium firmibasis TaxID=79012 RepID=A0AAN7TXX9_9MYCE